MKKHILWLVKRLLVVGFALAFAAVLLEVLLRLFVPVTDWPVGEYDPAVGLHRQPNQTGTWVVGFDGEVRGKYHINGQGWNSLHEYTADKPDGTLRIAVIGDSFIEAMQVDVDETYAALAEQALSADGACPGYDRVEVYSFGFGGAQLSQYLNVMRYVAERYAPDVFIINIFPVNDFDESLADYAPSAYSYFLTFRDDGQGGFVEVPPVPYTPSEVRRLMVKLALVRYVYGNLQLEAVIRRASRDEAPIADLQDELAALTRHIFAEYQRTAEGSGARLLLVMDADRRFIYGEDPPSERITLLSQIAHEATAEQGIALLDLTETFTQDYQQFGERFEFTVDDHWNERGHRLISEVVSDWVAGSICLGGENGG